jgi:hypothetical protein
MKPAKNGWIKLPRELVHSDKWVGLSNEAVRIFLDMWAFHNGSNNGQIGYGVTRAMNVARCRKRKALYVLRELRDASLIEQTYRGCFLRMGRVSQWRILIQE